MIILVITNKKENTTTEIIYEQIASVYKTKTIIEFSLKSGHRIQFERENINIEEINGEGFDLYS